MDCIRKNCPYANKSHKIVVMSGSMKFYKEMLTVAQRMSQEGCVVLIPFKDPMGSENISQEQKDIYDSEHRKRIEMADSMFVMNYAGYIGKSTQKEIDYAKKLGKEIIYAFPTIYPTEDKIMKETVDHFKDKADETIAKYKSMLKLLGYKGSVTICGSMKFYDKMLEIQKKYMDDGIIAYVPPLCKDDPETCGRIMINRITLSDSIYVVNVNGYIGDTTNRNIEYAKSIGKNVVYHHSKTSSISGKTVVLCGSRKFFDTFISVSKELTMNNNIVLMPAIFDFPQKEVDTFNDEQHFILDKIHTRKIDMADIVLIINPGVGDGYIGSDTRKEIEYAKSINKEIICMSNTDQDGRYVI